MNVLVRKKDDIPADKVEKGAGRRIVRRTSPTSSAQLTKEIKLCINKITNSACEAFSLLKQSKKTLARLKRKMHNDNGELAQLSG